MEAVSHLPQLHHHTLVFLFHFAIWPVHLYFIFIIVDLVYATQKLQKVYEALECRQGKARHLQVPVHVALYPILL